MNRKTFLKTCGYACVGVTTLGSMLQSCISTKSISASIVEGNMLVPLLEFQKSLEEGKEYRDYLIVQNDQLQHPIYLFRFSENKYSALYLKCSHQGNELNAYGQKLVCSAHGSEFDNNGNPTQGPASEPLKSFPVMIDGQNILISLKKA